MPQEIVDLGLVELSYSGGNLELDTVMSLSVGIADKKKAVKTMNRRRRAIGYQRGVPEFSGDLEVVLKKGTTDVDWKSLALSRESCLLTYEEGEGGQRWSLVDFVVDEASPSFREDGEIKLAVKWTALDHRKEP